MILLSMRTILTSWEFDIFFYWIQIAQHWWKHDFWAQKRYDIDWKLWSSEFELDLWYSILLDEAEYNLKESLHCLLTEYWIETSIMIWYCTEAQMKIHSKLMNQLYLCNISFLKVYWIMQSHICQSRNSIKWSSLWDWSACFVH